MLALWFVILKSILHRRMLQMTISDNKSWTLTTQKTTASEIDDLVVKGILSSVSRTLRNTHSVEGKGNIPSTFLSR